MHWLLRLSISGLSLILADWLLDSVYISGIVTAIIAAFILGLVNTIIRPILVFLTLPATVLSLGFFLLIINAFMYWFTSALVPGFVVSGFWGAFWGAIVTSIVTTILQSFIKD